MKYRRFATVASSCVAAAAVAVAATTGPTAPTVARAQTPVPTDKAHLQALYAEKCSACHNLPDPVEKNFTRAEWQGTVNKMLTKYKASDSISPTEAGQIVDYLATFAPKPSRGNQKPSDPWATDTTDVWTTAPSTSHVFNFESSSPLADLAPLSAGAAGPAAMWHAVASGTPDGAVVKEAPVKPSPSRFALLMDRADQGRNLDVKVRFQIQSGTVSPSVGIVFGFAGPKTYSVLRYDALHDTLSLLKIAEPTHTVLQQTPVVLPTPTASTLAANTTAAPPRHAASGWHTLRLLVSSGQIRGWVDMQKRISTQDASYQGGKIGLWTQGDTVAVFDDWTVDLYDAPPIPAAPAA